MPDEDVVDLTHVAPPRVLWEQTFASDLSSCTVTTTLWDDGRFEITLNDASQDEPWGEGLSAADTGELVRKLHELY